MVSELERKAWETRTTSEKHSPAMALKIALDDIERGVISPHHVIVVMVDDSEKRNGDRVTFYQAGSLSELASEGAMMRAVRIQQDG